MKRSSRTPADVKFYKDKTAAQEAVDKAQNEINDVMKRHGVFGSVVAFGIISGSPDGNGDTPIAIDISVTGSARLVEYLVGQLVSYDTFNTQSTTPILYPASEPIVGGH